MFERHALQLYKDDVWSLSKRSFECQPLTRVHEDSVSVLYIIVLQSLVQCYHMVVSRISIILMNYFIHGSTTAETHLLNPLPLM